VNETGVETRDLRDYLAVLRRRRLLVGVVFIVAVVSSLVASFLQNPEYRASADVQVRTATAAGEVTVVSERGLDAELAFAQSAEVTNALAAAVGERPVTSVRGDKAAGLIIFSAEADDPGRAAVFANAYANAFIEQRATARLTEYLASAEIIAARLTEAEEALAAIDAAYLLDLARLRPANDEALAQLNTSYNADRTRVESQRRRFQETLDQLSLSADFLAVSGTQIINPATAPAGPFSPDILRNLVTAALVALVLGIGLAFLVDYFDDTIKTREDFESVIEPLPTLSVIPRLANWADTTTTHVVSIEQPRSAAAEAYRSLRTAISFLGIDTPIKILQVTSPREQDGKTTTAANLAVVSALAGQRVLLIDGDLRRPRQHHFFNLEQNAGLSGMLRNEHELDEVIQTAPGLPDLDILTAGVLRSQTEQMLDSGRYHELVREIADLYGLVIIDSPPALSVADPLVMGRSSDAVLLVASAGSTHRHQVSATLAALAGVGAPVIGAVLNAFDARAAGYYSYRYGYGYGYGYASNYVYGYGSGSDDEAGGAGGIPVPVAADGGTTASWPSSGGGPGTEIKRVWTQLASKFKDR